MDTKIKHVIANTNDSETIPRCPLCSSADHDIVATPNPCHPESFQYWQCSQCHVIYAYPQLTAQALNHYYTGQAYLKSAAGYDTHNLKNQFYKERRFAWTMLNELQHSCNVMLNNKKVLDIGCATGGLLFEAKARGAQVYGVEPNQAYVDYAQQKIPSVVRDFYDHFETSETFDLIICSGVFHHFHEPHAILNKLHQELRDEGFLFLAAIPNAAYYQPSGDGIPAYSFVKKGGYMPFFYDSTILYHMLTQHSFSIEKKLGTSSSPKTTRPNAQPYKSLLKHIVSRFPAASLLCYKMFSSCAHHRMYHASALTDSSNTINLLCRKAN